MLIIFQQANRTGEILQTSNVDAKVDIRLRRSVRIYCVQWTSQMQINWNVKMSLQIDNFSTHILVNQLKITSFGMITINLRTVYLVSLRGCLPVQVGGTNKLMRLVKEGVTNETSSPSFILKSVLETVFG